MTGQDDQPQTSKPCHVAVLPSPGMGHIIPLFELAKRLAVDHGLRVTFLNITSESSAAQNRLLRSSAPPNLHVVDLPNADVSSATSSVPEPEIVHRLSIIVEENLKPLRSVLLGLGHVSAVVIDIFCTAAFEACGELSIPVYSFFTASTALFTFSLLLPTLDREVVAGREFVDLPEPIGIPGCPPIRTENILEQAKNRKLGEYKWYLRHVSRLPRAAGILLNTWEGLDPVRLRAIREEQFYVETVNVPKIHPVGPLVRESEEEEEMSEAGKECLTWLDRQPEGSVVFVALGSGGTLSSEEMAEVALGLEASGVRFAWVVRPPADVASGTYFDVGGDDATCDPAAFLPEGFGERTRGRGLVVPSWAPQVAVLGHAATGAFLTHCGWNSALESMRAGVAMIAWPLYAEQRMNAAVLAEDVGVAVRLEVDPTRGIVTRAEVERVARMVIEGEEGKRIQRKAEELKGSAARALRCGGTSYEALTRVVQEWKDR